MDRRPRVTKATPGDVLKVLLSLDGELYAEDRHRLSALQWFSGLGSVGGQFG